MYQLSSKSKTQFWYLFEYIHILSSKPNDTLWLCRKDQVSHTEYEYVAKVHKIIDPDKKQKKQKKRKMNEFTIST